MLSARMVNKCVVAIICVVSLVLACYLLVFHRPPPDVTLAANKSKRSVETRNLLEKDIRDMTPQEYSQAKWDAWVEYNGYVSIGDAYNTCDEDTRLKIGKVVMLKHPKTGSLMTKTYLNFTLENEVTTGDMGIQVWYNSQHLLKVHWELCHLEDDFEESERVLFCPLKAGRLKLIKEMPIPRYLPKGHYRTKSWAYDQNNRNIGCMYMDFTL